MKFWQRVHWFTTSSCNERCKFCFKPEFNFEDSPEVVQTLATALVKGKIREVVFTGGEPLLLRNLDVGLKILNSAGIDTSVHTNAILLTPKRLKDLVTLVDEVAIPIDSLDRETQNYLRGRDCLPKVKRVLRQLQDQKVRIGIHTVATGTNMSHLQKIYDFLKKRRFDYWRVYEYNSDLVGDRLKSVRRFREVQNLQGKGATASDGGVNSLFADFLLMEEQMLGYKDKRIQFVGIKDYDRTPYFFLSTNGEVHLCTWFLQGKRQYLGNMLQEGFETVKNRAIQTDAEGPLYDEEAFIDTENDSPLWARFAWEGNYFPAELDAVSPKYFERFKHLSALYLNRLKKQGKAPKTAELTI